MGESDRAAIFGDDPGQGSDASSGAANGSTPEYITRAEAEAMVNQASENAFRKAQGLIDTNVNRVEGRVQETLTALEQVTQLYKDAGLEVPPDIQQRAKTQAVVGSFTIGEKKPNASEQPAPSGAQAGQPGASGVKPSTEGAGKAPDVNQIAKQKMVQAGVNITRNSPSFALVDLTTDDPVAFLASVDKAIEAEKVRLASGGDGANLSGDGANLTPEQRRARMASLASGGANVGASLPDLPTGEDYLDLGYSQTKGREAPSDW